MNRNEPEDDNFLNDELEAHNLDHFPIQDIEIENQAVPVEFDIDKIKPDNKQFTSAAKSKLNKLKKSLPIAKKKNTTNRKKSTTSIRDLLFPLFSNINNNYKENMQTSNKTKITCDSDVDLVVEVVHSASCDCNQCKSSHNDKTTKGRKSESTVQTKVSKHDKHIFNGQHSGSNADSHREHLGKYRVNQEQQQNNFYCLEEEIIRLKSLLEQSQSLRKIDSEKIQQLKSKLLFYEVGKMSLFYRVYLT